MSSAEYSFQTYFCTQANSVNRDQTAPSEEFRRSVTTENFKTEQNEHIYIYKKKKKKKGIATEAPLWISQQEHV